MKKGLIIFMVLFMFLPVLTHAAGEYCGATGHNFNGLCNPTAKFAGNLPDFIGNLLKTFGAAVGFQAIMYVVFAGFKMVISQGDSEKLSDAKNSLQWTLSGLILILMSFALVYAVSEFIGASDVNPDISNPDNTQVNNPINSPTFGGPGGLTTRMLTGFLGVAGVIALLMIIINGFRYMLAGGNEEQTENAKQGLTWAVIGLCIISLGYVIVVATAKLFATVT